MLMSYIGGIDIDGHKVMIKRLSNKKWYELETLLAQIVEFSKNCDDRKLTAEFVREWKEIHAICCLFSIPIRDELKLNVKYLLVTQRYYDN